MWDTHGHTAGGVVFSLNPLDQARLLAHGFYKLVHALTEAQVPIYLISFPRIVSDFRYLFGRLGPVLPAGVDEDQAREAFYAVADRSKVRTTDEIASQRIINVRDAQDRSSLMIELAALRREVKHLRSELWLEIAPSKTGGMLASDEFVAASKVLPLQNIVQCFRPRYPVKELSVKFVTFARRPSAYQVRWKILGWSKGIAEELGIRFSRRLRH